MDHSEYQSTDPDAGSPDSVGSFFGERLFKPMNYDDLEDPELYRVDGYHPVHLGDLLGGNNRYKVLYKLGSGGLSTVWLCRDFEKNGYVALKILIAGASEDDYCVELKLAKRVWDLKEPGGEQIALPVDHFWITGSNGRHRCLVLPVLGPRVSEIWYISDDPGMLSRNIARQVLSGLQFLHRNLLCHGDLRPANILLRMSNLDHLSEDQIMAEFGEPETDPVLTTSEENHGLRNAPQYLVRPIDARKISSKYFTGEACIIDFGESYEFSAPPKDLGLPASYCSPELLFHEPTGPPSDIWALACTIFEIRSGQQLLQGMFGDEDGILMQMTQLFGKFPEPWWSAWEKRACWYDEEGNASTYLDDGRPTTHPITLEQILGEGFRYWTRYPEGDDAGEKKEFLIPQEEIGVLADLLYQMFRYDPEKRLTAAEVADHPWFARQ